MRVTMMAQGGGGFRVGDGVQLATDGGLIAAGALDQEDANLVALARTAMSTPMLAAETALNALSDQLLTLGIIPMQHHLRFFTRPPTPLEMALEWAATRLGPQSRTIIGRVESVDTSSGVVTIAVDSLTHEPAEPAAAEWPRHHRRRDHRGINGAPLAMRTKLKPWERR